VAKPKKTQSVVVIGGGPGGMKAAITAAQRGHRVSLFEKSGRLGGQVNLAEKLPGRAEFGGVTTNLIHELDGLDVEVILNTTVSEQTLEQFDPETIIIACGADARLPEVEIENTGLVDAWSVIRGEVNVGNRVVIADWSCDWNGLGVAQMLASEGHHVRLLSGASVAGESIQAIVRDQWIGELHRLNVEMIAYARFYGAVDGTAYFQHMTSGEPIVCENVDTIVSCFAPRSNHDYDWIEAGAGANGHRLKVYKIGDAMAPRTVEEAVLEGVKTAWKL
jgi:pyruvate/2-oxoglutarate dehydrogenase complex dihydrolipoamide dehydrogenase (E3) component